MTAAQWATLLPTLPALAALLPLGAAVMAVRPRSDRGPRWGALVVHVVSVGAMLAMAWGLWRAGQPPADPATWQLGAVAAEASPIAVFREPARAARASGIYALIAGALTAIFAFAPGPRAGRLLLALLGLAGTATLLVRRVHLASLEVIVGPQVVTLRSDLGAQQIVRARIARAQAFAVTARNERRSPVTGRRRDENIGAPTVRGLRFVDAGGRELFSLDEDALPPPDSLAVLLGVPIDPVEAETAEPDDGQFP